MGIVRTILKLDRELEVEESPVLQSLREKDKDRFERAIKRVLENHRRESQNKKAVIDRNRLKNFQ